MRIDKLYLRDFGQFHDKDISFAPGINVVYGANEAGKSTIKDFIVDMFYGIERSGEGVNRFDHYAHRKPIYSEGYSGAMEVSTDKGEFFIQRGFLEGDKYLSVKDTHTGSEVPVDGGSLVGSVIDTDKSTYLNTLCVGQMGAATSSEITERLNNYIVNMASAKDSDTDAVSAIMQLKEKRKQFDNRELEARENVISNKLNLDRDYDKEIAEVRAEYERIEKVAEEKVKEEQEEEVAEEVAEEVEDKKAAKKAEEARKKAERQVFQAKLAELPPEERDKEILKNMDKKSILDNTFVILLFGLLIAALFVGVAYLIPFGVKEVKISIIAFGAGLAIFTIVNILNRRNALYRALEDLEIQEGFEVAKNEQEADEEKEEDNTSSDNKDSSDVKLDKVALSKLDDLKKKEESIINDRKEQEELLAELNKIKETKKANEIECAALDLAIKTIQDLSEEIYDSFGSVLNEQVSRIVNHITMGRYSEVRIDEHLRVMVKNGDNYVKMEYLSLGTMEQIYLALRLAIADVLGKSDMPIVIDEAFVTYDEERLNNTLGCLSQFPGRQIILFTTNPEIQNMFINQGINSNLVQIS